MTSMFNTVAHKKWMLGALLPAPMGTVAAASAAAWSDADGVDAVLRQGLAMLPHCHLLYALDPAGTQISSNVSATAVETQWRGQNLATRPYLEGSLPYQGFILSAAYVSRRSLEPCITAIQAVRQSNMLVGFIAADFNLHDLPEGDAPGPGVAGWQQFKGDPAIRRTLFMQERVKSVMDECLDEVLSIMEALLRRYGIFHGKLHFSSSRFTLWHMDDPYNYRLHGSHEVVTPEVCFAYRQRPYPREAVVAPEQIRPVLEQFRELRESDETVYLRSGSINIMNGMVGLNFSCDGSHYMPVDDFLDKQLGFWTGAAVA